MDGVADALALPTQDKNRGTLDPPEFKQGQAARGAQAIELKSAIQ